MKLSEKLEVAFKIANESTVAKLVDPLQNPVDVHAGENGET